MKTCTKCEVAQPLSLFSTNGHGGLSPWCKPCKRASAAEWRRRNPAARRAQHNKERLQKFGLSASEYEEMLRSQDGRCAICGAVEPTLAIDHDHATGAVRGLLCRNCNLALGMLEDDPERLRKAASYLEVKARTATT